MEDRENKEVLLSGYFKGSKECGVQYTLLRTRMMYSEKWYYVIVREYGQNPDGTNITEVDIVGEDDNTCEAYAKAYRLYRLYVG